MASGEELMIRQVRDAIQQGVQAHVEGVYEEEKKKLNERLDKEKAHAVAGITLNIMRMMDVEQLKDRMVITLRTEEVKKG